MGQPKGLLPAPDTGEPLVARLSRIGHDVGLKPLLVGDASAYEAVVPDVQCVADRPLGVGPAGGLMGCLAAVDSPVIVVACDLPYVDAAALARLKDTHRDALALVPRHADGLYEPLFARYAPALREPIENCVAQGVRSLQAIIGRLDPATVDAALLGPAVRDWDRPEDVTP